MKIFVRQLWKFILIAEHSLSGLNNFSVLFINQIFNFINRSVGFECLKKLGESFVTGSIDNVINVRRINNRFVLVSWKITTPYSNYIWMNAFDFRGIRNCLSKLWPWHNRTTEVTDITLIKVVLDSGPRIALEITIH